MVFAMGIMPRGGGLSILFVHPTCLLQAQHWLRTIELGQMTHLRLCFRPVADSTLACLAQSLENAHQMRCVMVAGEWAANRRGRMPSMLRMPRRGDYEFHMYSPVLSESEVRDLGRRLEEAGFDVEEINECIVKFGYHPEADLDESDDWDASDDSSACVGQCSMHGTLYGVYFQSILGATAGAQDGTKNISVPPPPMALASFY